MSILFKYKIAQKVKTPFGQVGFIDMCSIDNSNDICYYVQTEKNNDWFKEEQLKEAE